MNNELYHHGVKGMRWGVRRYQKKDGTLTREGKMRYIKETTDNARKEFVANARASGKYSGVGGFRKANNEAKSVANNANEQARKDVRTYEEAVKYNNKVRKGSLHAVVGLAFENMGYKTLADIHYAKSDKKHTEWETRANSALAKLKNTKLSDLNNPEVGKKTPR